jgi:hypothetical protein
VGLEPTYLYYYGLLLNIDPVSLHFSSGKPNYFGALGTIVPALGCPQERISISHKVAMVFQP